MKYLELWARAKLDTQLDATLDSLEAEKNAFYRSYHCPFEDGHPECRCEEAVAVSRYFNDKIDAVQMEREHRYCMTAHQKIARIAAAQKELARV